MTLLWFYKWRLKPSVRSELCFPGFPFTVEKYKNFKFERIICEDYLESGLDIQKLRKVKIILNSTFGDIKVVIKPNFHNLRK